MSSADDRQDDSPISLFLQLLRERKRSVAYVLEEARIDLQGDTLHLGVVFPGLVRHSQGLIEEAARQCWGRPISIEVAFWEPPEPSADDAAQSPSNGTRPDGSGLKAAVTTNHVPPVHPNRAARLREQREAKKNWAKVDYALAYATNGFPVLPLHHVDTDGECTCGKLNCKSCAKHPLHNGWQAEATIDETTIQALWARDPLANIGVKCGKDANRTVLDVDGEQGKQSLRELELEHGELPDTPMGLTGSGGVHYYFQYEPQVVGRTSFAPGLDFRTEGNLVVGVGSRNANGAYVWEAAYSLGDLEPSKMPEWLKKIGQKQIPESVRHDES